MEKNPLNKGVIAENFVGIGSISRTMVRERAHELAVIHGRTEQGVSKTDWEQAKRELTGEPDMDPQQALLESLSEEYRCDPVPDSTGHKVRESPSEDEDDEGRSEGAQLVEEGVAEAEHDQMLQAARAGKREDKLNA